MGMYDAFPDAFFYKREDPPESSSTSKTETVYKSCTASLIEEMGHMLEVSQLCINTAIIYMERFYLFHSFENFDCYQIGAAALFLAAKYVEQPREVEHVIKVFRVLLGDKEDVSVESNKYQAQAENLTTTENFLIQTLGVNYLLALLKEQQNGRGMKRKRQEQFDEPSAKMAKTSSSKQNGGYHSISMKRKRQE